MIANAKISEIQQDFHNDDFLPLLRKNALRRKIEVHKKSKYQLLLNKFGNANTEDQLFQPRIFKAI